MTGWATLAAGSDWSRPPRQMIGTAYWFLNTDQWRYDRFTAGVLAWPLGEGRFEGMTGADCLALSARSGWMPSYPTFGRNLLELGAAFGDPVAKAVAELRAGTLKYDGGPGMGGDGSFGHDSGRTLLPLVSVENFHALRKRQTSDEAKEA